MGPLRILLLQSQELQQPSAAAATNTVTTAAVTANTTVDLLVVYTSTARAKQGGTSAMNALITLGVDLANQAYQNSQIAMRLRLVRLPKSPMLKLGT